MFWGARGAALCGWRRRPSAWILEEGAGVFHGFVWYCFKVILCFLAEFADVLLGCLGFSDFLHFLFEGCQEAFRVRGCQGFGISGLMVYSSAQSPKGCSC